MTAPTGRDETPRDEVYRPSVSPSVEGRHTGEDEGLTATDAFQTLASETRLAVLVVLFEAERNDEGPRTFSELQRATGADSSAGFAYHLRQLSGHFVESGAEGYVLTPVGRRAAKLVVDGALTNGGDRFRAS